MSASPRQSKHDAMRWTVAASDGCGATVWTLILQQCHCQQSLNAADSSGTEPSSECTLSGVESLRPTVTPRQYAESVVDTVGVKRRSAVES